MAEAKDRAAWNRTFAVLAQICNANRDPKKGKSIDPMQFFPWHDGGSAIRGGKAPPPTAEDRAALRLAFPGKKGGY